MMYTSRVPRVTIRPVLAPVRSISVLMAMVEPWISSSMAPASSPLLRTQSMTPCTSCAGVVRLLACRKRPAASSKPIRSVKVPPISIATTITLPTPPAALPEHDYRMSRKGGYRFSDKDMRHQSRAGLPHRPRIGRRQKISDSPAKGKDSPGDRRMRIWLSAVMIGCLVPAAASAQGSYPAKSVTIIVPAAPGGVTDLLGRVLAQRFTEAWDEQAIVENKLGANNKIA